MAGLEIRPLRRRAPRRRGGPARGPSRAPPRGRAAASGGASTSAPRRDVEREWRADGASGVFASRGSEAVGYLLGAPRTIGVGGCTSGSTSPATRSRRPGARCATSTPPRPRRWVDAGLTRHYVLRPRATTPSSSTPGSGSRSAQRRALRDARDGAGGSRSTADVDDQRRARLTTSSSGAARPSSCRRSMLPSPSFSDVGLQTFEEVLAEWREDDNRRVRASSSPSATGGSSGTFLLYRRPPDLRVPAYGDRPRRRPRPSPRRAAPGVGVALTAARAPLGARARLPE